MGPIEAVALIGSIITVGGKLITDLLAGQVTPEEAIGAMVREVSALAAAVADGGDLDKELAEQRAKFQARLRAIAEK